MQSQQAELASPERTGPVWTRADSIRSLVALGLIGFLVWLATWLAGSQDFGSQASISLVLGSALGIAFERGRFCFFCIWRDAIDRNYNSGLLAIYAAIGVGAIGYTVLFGIFQADPANGLPTGAHIGPVSIALVVAAFVFGLGMALSGACISGHIYRLAEGSLRAIVALVGAVIGFFIAFQSWNPIYNLTISSAPAIWLPSYVGYGGALVLTLSVLGILSYIALKKADPKENKAIAQASTTPTQLRDNLLKKRWSPWATGSIVGLVGVAAYLQVEPLGTTRQINSWSQNLASNLNIRPETLEGMDTFAGCIAVVGEIITNNGWLILGLFLAALAAAIASNRFGFESITIANSATALVGGMMLGWGSFIALGCTVGVLLTGTQSFAISGWIFLIFAFLGTFVGVKLKLNRI